MALWHLHRDDPHPEKNTVRGFLTFLGDGPPVVLQTVENLQRRIVTGTYQCVRDFWHGGQLETFEIIWPWDEDGDGQPDRDRLLCHPANAVRNRGGELILLGCVAPGLERVDDVWETFPGQDPHELARKLPGVSSSRTAFKRFMEATGELDSFELEITELTPGAG